MSGTIRRGTVADFHHLKELVGNPDKIMDEWSREQWSFLVDREDVEAYVAEDEGSILGYAVVRLSRTNPVSMEERPKAMITHLCAASGEGQLRQQLVQQCLAWARKKGAKDFNF